MAAGTFQAETGARPLRHHYYLRYERPQLINAQALADPTRCPSDHGGHSAQVRHLHRAHIVHADVHADNVMLRANPACFVLIDYSGCTGDSVYPLHLGYGASGYGGATHRPPTEPVRTAHGDYYRLARTILKQLYIGPEPFKRRHSDKDSSLPSHLDKELRTWLGPTTPFPPGSWQDSAIYHSACFALEGERRGQI